MFGTILGLRPQCWRSHLSWAPVSRSATNQRSRGLPMNTTLAFALAVMAAGLSQPLPAQPNPIASAGTECEASIPLDQIGATAEKQYSGDGLSLCAIEGGARLRCVFQKLDGEATAQGLWLISTGTNRVIDRFRVTAALVERSARKPAFLSPTGRVEVSGKV